MSKKKERITHVRHYIPVQHIPIYSRDGIVDALDAVLFAMNDEKHCIHDRYFHVYRMWNDDPETFAEFLDILSKCKTFRLTRMTEHKNKADIRAKHGKWLPDMIKELEQLRETYDAYENL
jgi:hypothetical protein